VGASYIYRGGGSDSNIHYIDKYDVPYVQVDKGEPKFDISELTGEQKNAWIDMVRSAVGNDFLSPQDFIKLSETPK
jgi:hypothetical protein